MKSFNKSCIFVCSEKNGCGSCGSKKLVKELKKLIKSENLKKNYTVVECACLGFCSQEIATVAFPENVILINLKKKDAPRLLERLENLRALREGRQLSFEDKLSRLNVVELEVRNPLSH